MTDHLTDPQAASWDDVKDELGLTEAERTEISAGAQELITEAPAFRLTEIRRRHMLG
jgi:hypothetical protein